MRINETQTQNVKNIAHVLYGVAVNLGDGNEVDPFELCNQAVDNFDGLSEEEKTKLKMNSRSVLRHIINITPEE